VVRLTNSSVGDELRDSHQNADLCVIDDV